MYRFPTYEQLEQRYDSMTDAQRRTGLRNSSHNARVSAFCRDYEAGQISASVLHLNLNILGVTDDEIAEYMKEKAA